MKKAKKIVRVYKSTPIQIHMVEKDGKRIFVQVTSGDVKGVTGGVYTKGER